MPKHNPIVEPIPDRVDSWRRHLKAANPSPKTIALYTKTATKFAAWLGDNGHSLVVYQVGRNEISRISLSRGLVDPVGTVFIGSDVRGETAASATT